MSIFKLPRLTTTQRIAITPELAELIYDTTDNTVYRGDGATAGGLPLGAGSPSFIHTQASAATTWTVNHNLGFRPAVEVFSAGGAEIDTDVVHTSLNQTLITLNAAATGSARFT